jgi:hypothetical protein
MTATTTRKRKKPRALFTPQQKELIKAVKMAVCATYEISEDELMKSDSWSIAELRYYCFWLTWKNTSLKDYAIAEAFGKVRNTVIYGLDRMESERRVYPHVNKALKTIADTANQYSKKFEWSIQPINTTP